MLGLDLDLVEGVGKACRRLFCLLDPAVVQVWVQEGLLVLVRVLELEAKHNRVKTKHKAAKVRREDNPRLCLKVFHSSTLFLGSLDPRLRLPQRRVLVAPLNPSQLNRNRLKHHLDNLKNNFTNQGDSVLRGCRVLHLPAPPLSHHNSHNHRRNGHRLLHLV